MGYYKNISLEKGMYSAPGKTFSQVLEDLDHSEDYRGTPLEGLDAYQRQLMRYGIRVSGPGSDTVESFFGCVGSAALFPEYVARAVRQGMEAGTKAADICATVANIQGVDHRTIQAGAGGHDLKPVAEGAQLPSTTIQTSKSLVNLHKRGRMLVASYEALRFQKLDLFTVTLRQIGAYISAAQMQDAVDTLINGDGAVSGTAFTPGTPDYADLVGLWGRLAPYSLNTLLAGTDAMQKLLNVPEFKDAQAGMVFQATGQPVTPLGAKLVHVPTMEAGRILALDKSCALEMVQAGDIVTDYDKLIDRQLDRAAISCTAGFARIFAGAAQGLSYTAE